MKTLIELQNELYQIEENEENSKKRKTEILEEISSLTRESEPEAINQAKLSLFRHHEPKEVFKELRKIESYYKQLDRNDKLGFAKQETSAIDEFIFEVNRPPGIPFPKRFGMINQFMYPGLVNTIGAFSGVGKSTFLLNLVHERIIEDKKSIFYSLEMTPGQVWARLFGQHLFSKENRTLGLFDIFNEYKKDPREVDGFIEKYNKNLIVVNTEGWTAEKIRDHYSYTVSKGEEPETVFIDYIQIVSVEPSQEFSDKRAQMIHVMSTITATAKSSQSAWILAAQTNRNSHKDGTDDHSAFQESARIEQDSALAVILSTVPSCINGERIIKANVSKNRFGRTGEKYFVLDSRTGYVIREADSSDLPEEKEKRKK